jgi:diguanylate cyclase (GGDEF)-like protein/PAS domain S-box-containing protein
MKACEDATGGGQLKNTVQILTMNAKDAQELRHFLAEARDGPFAILGEASLAGGLYQLATENINIILTDLNLQDSEGLATFDRLFAVAPDIPIMILASEDEETLAIEAVQRGAQGYLSKGYFGLALVPQALRNIIQRKAIEAALFVERERSRVILESIGEGVMSTDLDGNLTYVNAAAVRMTGWARTDALGRKFTDVAVIIDSASRNCIADHLTTAVLENKEIRETGNLLLLHRYGAETAIDLTVSPVRERNGGLSGAVVVLHDARESQAATLSKVTYLAEHDALTGLPNRLLLGARLDHAVATAVLRGSQLAVLFLDLDNFKNINDSLGHAIGDMLLQSVAQALTDCTRARDTIARQGGDEFILVMPLEKSTEDAALAAEKILAHVSQPYDIDGHMLHVNASIGISTFPLDGLDAATLLKNADTAMFHAKKSGRNNYQFFNAEMNVRAVERQKMEVHLRRSLQQGELVLYYQPKIDLRTGEAAGVEALLRWAHPERGMLLPDQFIPLAEDCGMIGPIGAWVLREACEQAMRWSDGNLRGASIAVNVSATEFRTPGFLERVCQVLKDTGIDAGLLELELTESVLMSNAESSRITLRALKSLGVKLVVDDFGTGYSSLSYLKQFPLDGLKIDQSFVRDVIPNSDNGIIIKAVICMSHSLQLEVVAEGIETQAQYEFLCGLNCDVGQGHFFSQALPANECSKLFRSTAST